VLVGAADLARRPGRVQPDQRVETILEDHHHVDAAEQLAQHDAFVHALAPVEPIPRVGDLFPVLEGGALVVSPELRARVELREVDQRLAEASLLPVLRAPREVLRNLEAKSRASSCSWMVAMSRFAGGSIRPSASSTQ